MQPIVSLNCIAAIFILSDSIFSYHLASEAMKIECSKYDCENILANKQTEAAVMN